MPRLQPSQRRGFGGHGPPLIVGGTGDRILRVAGEFADIVSVAGVFQVEGRPPGTLRNRHRHRHRCRRADALRARVRGRPDRGHRVARARPGRGAHGRSSGGRVGHRRPLRHTLSAEEILATPFVFVGTVDDMADQARRNRERYGFTYYTVHGPFMEAFGPVVERLRG